MVELASPQAGFIWSFLFYIAVSATVFSGVHSGRAALTALGQADIRKKVHAEWARRNSTSATRQNIALPTTCGPMCVSDPVRDPLFQARPGPSRKPYSPTPFRRQLASLRSRNWLNIGRQTFLKPVMLIGE